MLLCAETAGRPRRPRAACYGHSCSRHEVAHGPPMRLLRADLGTAAAAFQNLCDFFCLHAMYVVCILRPAHAFPRAGRPQVSTLRPQALSSELARGLPRVCGCSAAEGRSTGSGGGKSLALHRLHPLRLTLGACGRPREHKRSAPQEGLCLPGGVSVRFLMRLWRRLCALGPASVLAGLTLGVRTPPHWKWCFYFTGEGGDGGSKPRCSAGQGL